MYTKELLLSVNDCRELFHQLPVSLLCQQVTTGELYANPACLAQFGACHDAQGFISSLAFYDADTRLPLKDNVHPFNCCAARKRTVIKARIKSDARSLNCIIAGQQLEFGDERWVVLHIESLHENDVTALHFDNSPLANHLAFSRLLSSISSQLINVSTSQMDALIERSLGAFGEFCGVDRCYLFQFSADKTMMDNTHEWVAAGVEPYKDDLQNVHLKELPFFERIIKSEHVFKVDDVAHMPPEASLEKEEFTRERIQSVLCVAVHINDELFGFVGCDIIGSPYQWREHDIRYLKLIGEMLSNTLESVANRLSLQEVKRQLEEANQQLAHLANSDGLTGIANRRQFDECLLKAIKRGTRTQSTLSLLMVDVDHFKHYNDSFGHAAGDEALCKIAMVLEACSQRTDDLAARYGGEEFAVILPETNSLQAQRVAENILQSVRKLAMTCDQSVSEQSLTVSVGIATVQCHAGLSPSELVTQADKALYQAKDNGRDRVVAI